MWWKWVLCVLVPYLLGSISFGVLYARRKGHDIRAEGSHNTGASNALRVVGVKTGLMTFVSDVLKAVLAILFGKWLLGEYGGLLAGLFVVIGHNWPVFFQFKGGKGIACSCAVLVLNYPLYGAIAIGLCLLVIAMTRFISLGSLTMLVSFAIMILIFKPFFPYGLWAILIALLGIWRHRSNIQRLLQGKENKISFQKKG